ncbi:MAG TPA: hypothetical protein VK683_00615 [Rhizomicrobium sp.]|nr:hypothetical protein [Rhizomicrobium sp.]
MTLVYHSTQFRPIPPKSTENTSIFPAFTAIPVGLANALIGAGSLLAGYGITLAMLILLEYSI